VQYDRRLGSYLDDTTGDRIPRTEIELEVERRYTELNTTFQRATQIMLGGGPIAQWQATIATQLKLASTQMAGLGAGGIDGLGASHFRLLGEHLRFQFERLQIMSQEIAAGELSEAMIAYRVGLFAKSVRSIYYRILNDTRVNYEQFDEARRQLDPQAMHCPSCRRYATGNNWIPSFQVVEATVECECSNNCRCTVTYRRSPEAIAMEILQPSLVLQQVLGANRE
jgi:hypothetical protein